MTETEPELMNIYKIGFYGRQKGALGVHYWITATIHAADKESARLKLYDMYEHIRGAVFELKGKSPFDVSSGSYYGGP